MRYLVAAALLLGGCYRPSDPACAIACTPGPGACPSNLVCGAANLCEPTTGPTCNALLDARPDMDVDPDADIDARTDAMPSGCNAASFMPPTSLILGYQFTIDAAHARLSMTSGDEVRVNETNPDSNNAADYMTVAMKPAASIEMYTARIDPTGTLIYVTSDNGTAMDETLMFMTRRQAAGSWTGYETVTLKNVMAPLTFAIGAQLGGSTDPAFGKRRMPLWFGPNSFEEYVEETANAPNVFTFASSFNAADLGVTIAREPSFTPDGLRVVFAGQAGTVVGIFVSSRASVTANWEPAVLLYQGSSSDGYPYLTNDCRHLYWSRQGMGLHAVRP